MFDLFQYFNNLGLLTKLFLFVPVGLTLIFSSLKERFKFREELIATGILLIYYLIGFYTIKDKSGDNPDIVITALTAILQLIILHFNKYIKLFNNKISPKIALIFFTLILSIALTVFIIFAPLTNDTKVLALTAEEFKSFNFNCGNSIETKSNITCRTKFPEKKDSSSIALSIDGENKQYCILNKSIQELECPLKTPNTRGLFKLKGFINNQDKVELSQEININEKVIPLFSPSISSNLAVRCEKSGDLYYNCYFPKDDNEWRFTLNLKSKIGISGKSANCVDNIEKNLIECKDIPIGSSEGNQYIYICVNESCEKTIANVDLGSKTVITSQSSSIINDNSLKKKILLDNELQNLIISCEPQNFKVQSEAKLQTDCFIQIPENSQIPVLNLQNGSNISSDKCIEINSTKFKCTRVFVDNTIGDQKLTIRTDGKVLNSLSIVKVLPPVDTSLANYSSDNNLQPPWGIYENAKVAINGKSVKITRGISTSTSVNQQILMSFDLDKQQKSINLNLGFQDDDFTNKEVKYSLQIIIKLDGKEFETVKLGTGNVAYNYSKIIPASTIGQLQLEILTYESNYDKFFIPNWPDLILYDSSVNY